MSEKMDILPPGRDYPLLEDPAEVLALVDDNFTRGFNILNLPRIRTGAGGATIFRVETATGEETPKRISGIINAWKVGRVYWKGRAASNKPPDCTSEDGWHGVGDPGGDCKECPFAKFGSSINQDGGRGSGQACKEIRQVLFLTPGQMIPHLLNVPPTSTKAFDQYTLSLLSMKVPYWSAVTAMTLERMQSDTAQPYARIIFRLEDKLAERAGGREVFRQYHQRMKQALVPATINASVYQIEQRPSSPAAPAPESPEPPLRDDEIPF